MKLSIIIPIYNVEKYIERCLLSCVTQDVQLGVDYEIICVNDGTKDQSAFLAKNIASKYKGITVIDQENRGLSEARNTGFRNIHGEYVWFVDSDDWIEENCLGRIIRALNNNIDILQLQYRNVYEGNKITECSNNLFLGIKTGREVFRLSKWLVPVQFSIYRSFFLKDNNLFFVPGIYHEDSEFTPRALYLAQKVMCDTCVSYNYLRRLSGSITSSFKLKNGIDIIFVNNSLLNFIRQRDISQKDRIYFYRLIGMNMNTLFFGMSSLTDKDAFQNLIEVIDNNIFLFKYMLYSNKLKYIFEGLCFLTSIRFGFKIYCLIKDRR